MPAASRLRVVLIVALIASAAAVPRHEEAPVVGVNGTFNTHFSARIEGLNPGACIIFEAQARAPQSSGELCISAAGVKLTGGTGADADDLLPQGCKATGLRIAEVVADDPRDCFLHQAAQLDIPNKIPEECDPKSPFSYQFIDPTRHFTTYGPQTSRPISDMCTKLLQELPPTGTVEHDLMQATLGRSSHSAFSGKCLKSVTYVIFNPCYSKIGSMQFEGTSKQCTTGWGSADGVAFPKCTAEQGGTISALSGALSAVGEALSGLAVLLVIGSAAATAFFLLFRRRTDGVGLKPYLEESTELTGGALDSSKDPDKDLERQ